MPKATFRFYEELNDFLPIQRRKADFEADIKGKRSIKDIAPQIREGSGTNPICVHLTSPPNKAILRDKM